MARGLDLGTVRDAMRRERAELTETHQYLIKHQRDTDWTDAQLVHRLMEDDTAFDRKVEEFIAALSELVGIAPGVLEHPAELADLVVVPHEAPTPTWAEARAQAEAAVRESGGNIQMLFLQVQAGGAVYVGDHNETHTENKALVGSLSISQIVGQIRVLSAEIHVSKEGFTRFIKKIRDVLSRGRSDDGPPEAGNPGPGRI